ncbi:hypothetical protein AX16_006203 [Volvariella volvacea WC 439]|nr:hypothetical protein AX16_006203 [Volvariella volvacea WC 439]
MTCILRSITSESPHLKHVPGLWASPPRLRLLGALFSLASLSPLRDSGEGALSHIQPHIKAFVVSFTSFIYIHYTLAPAMSQTAQTTLPAQVEQALLPLQPRSRLSIRASSHKVSGSLSSPRAKPHRRYYMSEGDIVIKAENTLFKLPLATLHGRSPVLRTIMPPVYGGETRYLGFNDERPFILPEIKSVDFVRLLYILFPCDDKPFRSLTVDDWISILKLSTLYQMDDIRQLSIVHLDILPLEPIRKIAIWEEYHLDPAHLIPSYVELCQRLEPLTLQMTMTLGLKNFTRLAAARDLFHRKMGCGSCMHGTFKERQTVAEDIVKSVFSKQDFSGVQVGGGLTVSKRHTVYYG